MKASSKTKQALTEDLASLRRRIGELEQSEVERKKIEEALRESERRLNALYQESPIPTFTWQKQGDDFFLVDFNRAAVQITDGKAYNFLGKSATEFYQDEPQTLEDMRRCFTEHSVIRRDLIAKHFAPEKSLSVHFAFIPPDLIIVHAEDQTDHRRMEKTLRESEEKYRSLFDNTIDAVLLSAPNGRILAANPKACQIFGRTEEEICRIGREGLVDLTDPRLAAALEERVRTGQFRGELTYVRKNGTLFPGEVSSVIFRDRDGNSRTSMIIRDITESKRAEAKLRQQTDAMEAAIDGMALLNEEGEYIYLNKAHAQIYGYENTGELIGKSWRILYDSDELQRFEHEIMPEFGRKGHWYGEAIGKKKDGSKFPQEISLTAMANGGLICVVRDITEHKREEEALHLSEENFRRSLDDSPLGVRVVTAEGETLYANRAILDIYGYDSIDELRKTPVKNRYTPQSYAEFKIRMEKRKRGNGPSEYEISIVRENGEIRHLQVFRKEIFWDSARQFQTVYQDITDRKQAEEALRERDIQFKKLSSWVPGMIYQFTKRPDGTYFIPFTTEAIKDIFGCSPQDVREDFSPIARVILPEDFNKLVDSIEYSAKHLTVWTCEYRVQIPGKSIQWMLGNSTPEKLADGSITWYGFNTDITDRKRAEYQINERMKELQIFFSLTEITDKEGITLEKLYQEVADLLPKSWQYPEITCSRLVMGGREFRTKNFKESAWMQSSPVNMDGSVVGKIDIAYLEEKPEEDEGPFIHEERLLINTIAKRVGRIAERMSTVEKLQQTLESLRKAFGATIQVMVSVVEARDPYTSGHQIRSADLARAIATEMGLPQEKVDGIRMAGSIHDIGKLSIPAEILAKPTKLSEIEFSLMKEHSLKGYEMLKDVESPWPLAQIVYQHHERMDGSGYPRKLKGDDIIIEARILAVADVVEAMASHRPYRPALGLNVALDEIEKNKGRLYDADSVDACLKLFRERNFKIGEA